MDKDGLDDTDGEDDDVDMLSDDVTAAVPLDELLEEEVEAALAGVVTAVGTAVDDGAAADDDDEDRDEDEEGEAVDSRAEDDEEEGEGAEEVDDEKSWIGGAILWPQLISIAAA